MSQEPSLKARDQMGKQSTRSQETVCKYCFDNDFLHPQALKHHMFMDHWFSTRREMYQKEEEYVEFMEGMTK